MSDRFDIADTPLAALKVLRRKPIGDERGLLERLYCAHELRELLPGQSILQINRTLTRRAGTVRGLHFQHPPHAETKFVSCLRGSVYDVAVDIRRGSPTFLQWHAEILSDANSATLVIPAGFAHGFQTLSDECELLYLHTALYRPESEGGLNVRDPLLAIRWPREVAALSARDSAHPLLTPDFGGIAP